MPPPPRRRRAAPQQLHPVNVALQTQICDVVPSHVVVYVQMKLCPGLLRTGDCICGSLLT